MKLRHKSQLLIISAAMLVVVVFAAISLYSYRSYSINSLERQAQIAAELIRLTVTHEMTEGNPEHKKPFIENLLDISNLKHARIMPSPKVVEQMGVDISERKPISREEEIVMSSGDEQYLIFTNEDDDTLSFVYSIPYIASSRGHTNCLNCHDAREGEVLGVVSLEMDVTEQYHEAIKSTLGIVLIFVLFAAGLALALRRFLNPVEHATEELDHALSLAEVGDFSGRMIKRSDDEIGNIAQRTNHFMEVLDNSIGSITKDLDTLTGHRQIAERENLLNTTVSVVHTMAMVAQFKQVIENDRTLDDVYRRFQHLLEKTLHFSRYSFYEVSNSNNRLKPIFVGGLPEDQELWCSREVIINCEFCRAKRTAMITNSNDTENICPSYTGTHVEVDLKHICLPMILSGSVGGVLQIVYHASEHAAVMTELPVLQSFMDEAAPVIEAKRLMQSLRDSSMRDPMTNLYNRRFLEEHLETIVSGVKRRKTKIGVLMCDVDHFKHVNDTYGHDVGDDVLKGTCSVIKAALRDSDLIIRYGGEEFLALLIDTEEEGVMVAAERIREGLEAHHFKTPQGSLTKTMSLGVSIYPEDSDDFWDCAKYADIALYEAKEGGRNRVLRYKPGMQGEDS